MKLTTKFNDRQMYRIKEYKDAGILDNSLPVGIVYPCGCVDYTTLDTLRASEYFVKSSIVCHKCNVLHQAEGKLSKHQIRWLNSLEEEE